MRSLDAQKDAFESERADLVKKVDVLERDQQVRDREIDALKDKVRQFADYDEVKRELEIMKVRLSLSFCCSRRRFLT